jgi:hypothetical protein
MNTLASSSSDNPPLRPQNSRRSGNASRFLLSMRKSITHTLLPPSKKRNAAPLVSEPSNLPHMILIHSPTLRSAVVCILPWKKAILMFPHECTRDTEDPSLPVLPSSKSRWVSTSPAHPTYAIRVTSHIQHLLHLRTYGTPTIHLHCTAPRIASHLPLPALPSRKPVPARL